MPKLKRSGIKSQEVKTGFEAYDGPEPTKRGFYRAKIASIKLKQFRSGSQGYQVTTVLEAQKGDPKDHAQFDGYAITSNLVFGDKEAMITRESNFYAALGVPDEPDVLYDAGGDLEQGVKITKIGGKNPLNQVVNVDIRQGTYEGNSRPEVDGIYKFKEYVAGGKAATPAAAVSDEDDEDLLEEDEEAPEEGGDEEYEAREAELNGLALPALRKIAKELEITTTGLKKDGLVEAILGAEFEEPEEAEDEDAEEDEEDEDEAEDEAEDEEEPDDSERRAELAAMTRVQLKAELKKVAPDFTVLKRHSEADLLEEILSAEAPF